MCKLCLEKIRNHPTWSFKVPTPADVFGTHATSRDMSRMGDIYTDLRTVWDRYFAAALDIASSHGEDAMEYNHPRARAEGNATRALAR